MRQESVREEVQRWIIEGAHCTRIARIGEVGMRQVGLVDDPGDVE
jgi:hypothetical protein